MVHVGGGLDALFGSAQDAGRGRVPRDPTMVVGQHSVHDPTRAPAGRHTVYVYARVPQVPDPGDEEVVELMEHRIERFAPGFRRLVMGCCAHSPRRLERENPSLVDGEGDPLGRGRGGLGRGPVAALGGRLGGVGVPILQGQPCRPGQDQEAGRPLREARGHALAAFRPRVGSRPVRPCTALPMVDRRGGRRRRPNAAGGVPRRRVA